MSAIKLSFVAVNRGGACGGALYFAGAIVEFVRGLKWSAGTWSGLDLTYCSREGVRRPSRTDARIAERAMKIAIVASKSFVMREVATVSVWYRSQRHKVGAGQGS